MIPWVSPNLQTPPLYSLFGCLLNVIDLELDLLGLQFYKLLPSKLTFELGFSGWAAGSLVRLSVQTESL